MVGWGYYKTRSLDAARALDYYPELWKEWVDFGQDEASLYKASAKE